MNTVTASESAPTSWKEQVLKYFRDFRVLKETSWEYWGVQVVNFLDCAFYFAMITIAAVFLSEDLKLSDESAGYVVMLFTSATTIFLFISGMFTDWLGIRKSIYISIAALLCLRLGLFAVGMTDGLPYRGIIAGSLFFLMAPFMAMIQTSFQAANKRYTTKKSRSAGFNLWYLFMNVGAIASGVIIDVIRKGLGLPNSYIFLTGVLTAVICFFTALLMIRNNDQLGEEEKEEKSVTAAVAEKKTPLTIAREVVREPAFWRLMVFILFTLGVRAVFTYNYLLMPKYWLRTIGPDASIGVLQIINPIIIVAGLILLIPIVNKLNLFKSLVGGSAVSALSMLPMVLPWQLYSSNIATAHYLMAIACMVTLALGELFWSPRLNEYTAAVAPKGQEGTYLGLTMIPWFAAKTIVSLLSGHMLHRWSPEQVGVAAPDLVAKARETGLGAAGLADKIMPADLADKAQSLGTNILDLVRNVDPTAVMAQA